MNEYTHEVVVIRKQDMSKFIDLALRANIDFTTMDASNASKLVDLAQMQRDSVDYYQSSEEYDDSGCTIEYNSSSC